MTNKHLQLAGLRNQIGPIERNHFLSEDQFATAYSKFLQYGAFPFHGENDVIIAAQWLGTCEYSFERIGMISEYSRVDLAATQLRSDARTWWKTVKEAVDVTYLTWEQFTHRFQEEYIPHFELPKIEERFLHLQQGTDIFHQYHLNFRSFSRHVSHLVDTEQKLIWAFIAGLKPSLRAGMSSMGHHSFDRMIDVASRVNIALSAALEQEKIEVMAKRTELYTAPSQIVLSEAIPSSPINYEERICYNCRRPGHYAKDCLAPRAPKKRRERRN